MQIYFFQSVYVIHFAAKNAQHLSQNETATQMQHQEDARRRDQFPLLPLTPPGDARSEDPIPPLPLTVPGDSSDEEDRLIYSIPFHPGVKYAVGSEQQNGHRILAGMNVAHGGTVASGTTTEMQGNSYLHMLCASNMF